MQGNDAIGWGALAAGCRFYAGYPITPSTEIAEILARELPKVGGKFIQMEDEIASMAAIIGASVGGLKSMTATSGPGLLADAGEHRLRRHDRDPLRGRGCPAAGTLHRPAHRRLPGRRDAGPLGHPRRPSHHCPQPHLRPPVLRPDREGLQLLREIPHPGHPADGRDHRAHARAGRSARSRRPSTMLEHTRHREPPEWYKPFRNDADGECRPWRTFGDGLPLPHHRPVPRSSWASPPSAWTRSTPGWSGSTARLDKHLDDIVMVEEDYQDGAEGGLRVLRRLRPHRPPRREAGRASGAEGGHADPADHLALPRGRRWKRWASAWTASSSPR